jgi:hypothetical protein
VVKTAGMQNRTNHGKNAVCSFDVCLLGSKPSKHFLPFIIMYLDSKNVNKIKIEPFFYKVMACFVEYDFLIF